MDHFAVFKVFLFTVAAFTLGMAAAPGLLRLLVKFRLGKNLRDAKDTPVFAALHAGKKGTPVGGGILVWGTVVALSLVGELLYLAFGGDHPLGALSFLDRGETLLPIGALLAASLVGLVDDYFNARGMGGGKGGGLRLRHRVLLYLLIALIGALWFTFKLDWDQLRVPFVGTFNIGWWFIPYFILVIVATGFSVNETDGLDGLAGGTLLTSFAAMAAVSYLQGKYDLAVLCGVIVGGLAAFLWHNINPAKFFMGDTGAMGLGVTLGVVAMLTNTSLLLPVFGVIFVMESASVIIQIASKKLRGKKVFRSSPVHHHFEAIGWKEPQIVMRFWLISGMAAAVALVIALVDWRLPV
jgi:phospho-N-acetylmuramoyl-pentapeptide-transferase